MLKKEKNQIYITMAVLSVLLFVGLFTTLRGCRQQAEETMLHHVVFSYRIEGRLPEETKYAPESAEALFVQGLTQFAQENYAEAKVYFEQGLTADGKDKALPIYLRYYLNECIYMLEGTGSMELVREILELASPYSPIVNDRDMFLTMLESVSYSEQGDKQLIPLLQAYLEKTKELPLVTVASVKNYIGMLQYINEEYANAIRNFYDVELLLEYSEEKLYPKERPHAELEKLLAGELRFAKEYIAHIYYIFQYYEEAAVLYREVVESAAQDIRFHEASACLNLAEVSLKMEDIQGAKDALVLLGDVINRIPKEDQGEVQAQICDVAAKISMLEKNMEQAEEYLRKAEEYYRTYDNSAVIGGGYFIQLTRCEYLIQAGELAQAELILEKMATDGTVEYYGLQQDVYQLLEKIYEQTGQDEKLLELYRHVKLYIEETAKTTQREYLEFSKYYRENNVLKMDNLRLTEDNEMAWGIAISVFCTLLIVLLLMRLLDMKNITDQLTGIYNRKKLNRLLRQYEKTGTPSAFGVVMTDIDYFKRYNDTYGHPAGDEVLKTVAQVLKSSVQRKDTVIRYGGEEFLLLLQEASAEIAQEVCERIRKNLAEQAILNEASLTAEHVTLSIGLCYQKEADTAGLESLIEQADACLYQSKENGRNRVTMQMVSESAELEK